MLSLLKKKSDADADPAQPAWHPNFRNYKKLPDIKVVRTAFFVNGLSIAMALALVAYVGFREWQLKGLKDQLAQVQSEIDRDKKVSDQAVALFKNFQAEETKVVDVDTFVKSKPLVSSLIIRLAQTLPKNVALDNIDLRDIGMTLRLSIKGDAVTAGGFADAYLEQLRKDKELSLFGEASFTSPPTRNPATGKMAVEFFAEDTATHGRKKIMTSQDLVGTLKKNPVSVTCVVVSVIMIALIFLRGDLTAETQTLLEQKSAESEKLRANIQYSAQLKEHTESMTNANKRIESRIIRASQLGTNTQYFYTIESETGAKLIDIRQTTPATVAKPAKGSYLPVAFAVSVQGDLNRIMAFLRQVENGAHYSRIMNATLSGNSALRDSPLTLALNVELLGTP